MGASNGMIPVNLPAKRLLNDYYSSGKMQHKDSTKLGEISPRIVAGTSKPAALNDKYRVQARGGVGKRINLIVAER